jgi:hypothetical protein
MSDLKSILPSPGSRCSLLNPIQQWRVERRRQRALRFYLHRPSRLLRIPSPDSPADVRKRRLPRDAAPIGPAPLACVPECRLKEVGFTPCAEVQVWKRRFHAAMAIYCLLLVILWLTGAVR